LRSAAGVGNGDDFNFPLEGFAINQDKWELPEQESAGQVGTNCQPGGARMISARARCTSASNLRAASGLRSRNHSNAASYSAAASS
jgi:hypothetical protein